VRLAAALTALAVLLVGMLVPRPTDGRRVVAAVVQGNVPQLGLDFNAQRAAVLRNHVEATEQLAAEVAKGKAAQPQLVVWPENASDIDPLRNADAAALISQAARAIGVPILVGAVLQGPGGHPLNASIVWSPTEGPVARYVKRHPAPFGEYIPLRSLVRPFNDNVDRVVDFLPGHGVSALPLGPARVAPVICFEVLDDGLVRSAVLTGADLVTVQTNNATFGRSPESAQQLQMSRLRAVEHGRTVLSASTTGVSAVIAPDGAVLASTDVFTRDVMVQKVPLRSATTVADRVGGWPELLLAILGALAVAAAGAGWLRRRRTPRPAVTADAMPTQRERT
jgi:apolipoprotein N-acyltransferase